MQLGFFTANFTEKSLEEVIQIIEPYGYESLEIPAYEGNGQLETKDILTGNRAAEIRKMVASHGMSISALSNHSDSFLIMGPTGKDTDFIFQGTPEEKIKHGTESLIRTAQAANALEVPTVVGYPGVENWGRFFFFPYGEGWSEYEEQFVERFTPILDKFQEYGVRFAIEIHPNSFVYDINTAVRALELVNYHPALGYNFDPANTLYLMIDPATLIDTLQDRIYHVHAKDAELAKHNLGTGGTLMHGNMRALDHTYRFRIPGWGQIDWKSILTELSLVGYDGVLSYEHEDVTMSRMDGVKKVSAFLKPLLIEAPYEGRQDKLFNKD